MGDLLLVVGRSDERPTDRSVASTRWEGIPPRERNLDPV